MAITRKEFLKLGLVAGGAGLALSSGSLLIRQGAWATR
jgi:hypothetical protein